MNEKRNVLITGSSHGIGAAAAIAFAKSEGANIGFSCNKNPAGAEQTGGWCGRYGFSTNPSCLKGDGLAFAEALGGAVRDVDDEHVQYEPTVRVRGQKRGMPVITTLLYEGARLLNDADAAFLPDARLNKDELSRAVAAAWVCRGGKRLTEEQEKA